MEYHCEYCISLLTLCIPTRAGFVAIACKFINILHDNCSIAQWAKSGFFVQWVYWVYLFSQNTRPLCNAAMYEQV